MIASPENVRTIGTGLDHPECLCLGRDGNLYAGGEAGQIYRVARDGSSQKQIASTGGFVLGVTMDGNDRLHVCDLGKTAVLMVDQDGKVSERSSGTATTKMRVPNYNAFDSAGNLYVSDSGDYFDKTGTGCIFVIRPSGKTELFHKGPLKFANGLAVSPDEKWLYIVQSTAFNVVRVPLGKPDGPVEVTHQLPQYTVADGIAFSDDGRLVIACYRPDVVYLGHPNGSVEVLIEDFGGELLSRPANVAIGDGELFISNLGGWHLSAVKFPLRGASLQYPKL